MDEAQFRAWLEQRNIDEVMVNTIIADIIKLKELYSDQVRVGAALDHETWLDDLTSSARGDHFHQVLWVVSGLTGALVALIEQDGDL